MLKLIFPFTLFIMLGLLNSCFRSSNEKLHNENSPRTASSSMECFDFSGMSFSQMDHYLSHFKKEHPLSSHDLSLFEADIKKVEEVEYLFKTAKTHFGQNLGMDKETDKEKKEWEEMARLRFLQVVPVVHYKIAHVVCP